MPALTFFPAAKSVRAYHLSSLSACATAEWQALVFCSAVAHQCCPAPSWSVQSFLCHPSGQQIQGPIPQLAVEKDALPCLHAQSSVSADKKNRGPAYAAVNDPWPPRAVGEVDRERLKQHPVLARVASLRIGAPYQGMPVFWFRKKLPLVLGANARETASACASPGRRDWERY